MSVQSQIERISAAVADSYTAAADIGATIPQTQTVDNLPETIRSIPTGGIKLDSIAVTTPPTKTSYLSGERFDPTGMVVTATYSNGEKLAATGYAVEPSGPLSDGMTSVTIRYTEGGVSCTDILPITVIHRLESIAVTTPPDKTVYEYGDAFSKSGMVVKATYSDGAVEIVSSYSYSPVTFTTIGAQDVTVSYTERGVTKTVTLTVTVESLPAVGTALNDCSWEDISKIAASGLASNYFSVGDTKAITLSGTASKLGLNGTYYVYILGFNHNGAANTIDFGTFKTALSGGIDIALISGSNDYSDFGMNTTPTNSGGWKNSDMRYTILGSSDTKNGNATASTATNPVENTLLSTFPSDLRAIMKPMTVYTDNTGGGSNTASDVTSTVDYLPLLAEFEVFGERRYANRAEQNYQKQYDYYAAGNSKIKYQHSSTGSTVGWWERSPYYSGGTDFCRVSSSGKRDSGYSTESYGVAPVFRV